MKENVEKKVKNTYIKFIKSLGIKKNRYKEKLFVVEGENNFIEIIKSKYEIDSVLCSKKFYYLYENIFINLQAKIYILDKITLNKISFLSSNQMVLCIVKMQSNNIFLLNKNEYCLAIDNLQNPNNLGAILRICDWYNIKKIVISNNTVDVFNPKTIQASMGSFANVNIMKTDLVRWLSKNIHMPILGTFIQGKNVRNFKFKKEGIIVIGNEANGISASILPYISEHISIPKKGFAQSLNASVATAVVLDNIQRILDKFD